MGLFAIGTAPALLSIGGLTLSHQGHGRKTILCHCGISRACFGIFNINNSFTLVGFGSSATPSNNSANSAEIIDGIQIVRMTQKNAGYYPNSFTVKKGVPVKWIITSEAPYSCAASISMPSMNIQQNLRAGENVIAFTPTQSGRLPFSCAMGMYRGTFTVIDAPSADAGITNTIQSNLWNTP